MNIEVRSRPSLERLAYTALEKVRVPRPVDRLGCIESYAVDKRVFDLGALDETAFAAKKDQGNWLHARLCRVATQVVGIDNSALIPEEGLLTAENGQIINGDIFDLSGLTARFGRPDLIIAGELIEHLPDTLDWLHALKRSPTLSGVKLVVSTPNACSWHNGLIGIAGRESTHPDHLQIYSYKVLRTLFDRAGIQLEQLIPYHARFDEMLESSQGAKRMAVKSFQTMVNLLETSSPMLSAGWIAVARI
jgi:hypothetical protein